MSRAALLSVVFMLVTGGISSATILRVPSEYPNIQAGVDAAVDGDTVLVADGIYIGNSNRNIRFYGKGIVVMSENGPEVTIINTGWHKAFLFDNGEDTSSVVQGFTILGANTYYGGAIYCSESSPTIRGNIIRGNKAWYGGGIYCASSSAVIEGNVIMENVAYVGLSTKTIRSGGFGGGIRVAGSSSSPIIRDNIIVRNTSEGRGGGIALDFTDPATLIEGNLIVENLAASGGGLYCTGSPAAMRHNTVSGNTASWYGGGIRCEQGASVSILNSIFWENRAEREGDEIYVPDTTEIAVTYSDIKGGWEGEGNIDADPLFLLPDKRDYRLLWDSPCIDTGHPDSLDPDGTRSDMGAFSFDQSTPLTIYLTPDTTAYHRREYLGVTYTVINISPDPVTFSLQTDVYLPNGKPYPGNPIVGPKEVTLNGGKTRQRWIKHYIPGKAPFGVFTYTTTLNSVFYNDVIDEDSFRFAIEE
jgi:hypothetical protein